MSESQAAIYFLKKSDGTVYGPALLEMLQAWAREGRIAPDDLLSKDQELWYPAPTLTELAMNWLVHLPDGTQYGPIHLMALHELAREGSLSPDDLVTDRTTERVCTLREAVAQFLQEKTPPPPFEITPAEKTAISKPEPVRAAQHQKATDGTVLRAPAASAEKAPFAEPALEQSPQKKVPTTTHLEPPPDISWRDVVAREDFLERETKKWKKLYEQEYEQRLRITQETEARIQALKKSELAALTRINQLERQLRESEENYRMLKESLTNDPANLHAQQLVALTELYRDLSQRYDALASRLDEKNGEIAELLESRNQVEMRTQEQLRQMQEVLDRERREGDQARRRALEIEADYLHLVKSYRELNDRFMQARQQASSAPAPAPSVTERRMGKR